MKMQDMKIRVLGGGWYGCHIAAALIREGAQVELHETAAHLFAGASGGNPARLHLGFHYPRSRVTRAMCQETHAAFMRQYGDLTRTIACNIYAVAERDSWVDFGTYLQVLRGEVEFVRLERPAELGLRNVEGAVLTGERHIVIREARHHFTELLRDVVRFGREPNEATDADYTIDCTFCARDGVHVDRYEPCVTGLLEGPTGRAVTVMDGPFPSVYPWDDALGCSSITSAKYTPLDRCATWEQAAHVLRTVTAIEVRARVDMMIDQMAHFWPAVRDLYRVADAKLTIRAQPASGADARFVDIVDDKATRTMRIRAGKIDAILHAEGLVMERLCSL